jgi:hypothetical protein
VVRGTDLCALRANFKCFDGLVTRNSFFFGGNLLFLELIGCLYVFQFQNKLFSAESFSFSSFIIYCISLYLYIKFTLFLF